MNKFKISSIFVSCALMFTSLVGCASSSSQGNNSSSNANNVQNASMYKVGMVTDEGGLGDKSFNSATYDGLLKAKEELGVDIQVLEPKQDTDFEAYTQRISKNSNLVIGVGYKLKDAVEKASKQNAGVKYIIIDDEVKGDNVHSLRFKEEEGSFLAGVVAGLMTKTNKIGFIGGYDSPLINKFDSGFAAGVKSVNPEAGKLLEDRVTVRYAGSFVDTAKGYELAKSLYGDGVDIIYHAAGGVGIGMFRAASETNNYGIGVDQDQAVSLPEYANVILTSVVKNLTDGVYDLVKEASEGVFNATTSELGVKENGVYLSESTKDKVPQDILDKVEEFKNKIISGEITVPKTIEELKNFKY